MWSNFSGNSRTNPLFLKSRAKQSRNFLSYYRKCIFKRSSLIAENIGYCYWKQWCLRMSIFPLIIIIFQVRNILLIVSLNKIKRYNDAIDNISFLRDLGINQRSAALIRNYLVPGALFPNHFRRVKIKLYPRELEGSNFWPNCGLTHPSFYFSLWNSKRVPYVIKYRRRLHTYDEVSPLMMLSLFNMYKRIAFTREFGSSC